MSSSGFIIRTPQEAAALLGTVEIIDVVQYSTDLEDWADSLQRAVEAQDSKAIAALIMQIVDRVAKLELELSLLKK